MVKRFIRNPLSIWFVRAIQATLLEYQYRKKNLKIGGMSFAEKCTFGKYNVLYNHVSLVNVHLEDGTYIANGTTIINSNIGKFCSIGPEVMCGLGIHPTDLLSTHPSFYSTRKQAGFTFVTSDLITENTVVNIGHDVWIGARAMIADGVTIGCGAIIAAGAVVTKNVPPYGIVGGVPAKLIRFRFTPETIERLMKQMWWNSSIDEIARYPKKFQTPIK